MLIACILFYYIYTTQDSIDVQLIEVMVIYVQVYTRFVSIDAQIIFMYKCRAHVQAM